jgi:hypothetical protein
MSLTSTEQLLVMIHRPLLCSLSERKTMSDEGSPLTCQIATTYSAANSSTRQSWYRIIYRQGLEVIWRDGGYKECVAQSLLDLTTSEVHVEVRFAERVEVGARQTLGPQRVWQGKQVFEVKVVVYWSTQFFLES